MKVWMLGTATAAVVVAAGLALWNSQPRHGRGEFFGNHRYNFETLAVLHTAPAGGADIGEVLRTVEEIKEGDEASWHRAWKRRGDMLAGLAKTSPDARSAGEAWLRAYSYYKAAGFFLTDADPRHDIVWNAGRQAFYRGIQLTRTRIERIDVPYAGKTLHANYYAAPRPDPGKPLLVFVGGFDSTLEDLYFALVPAALERGYSVLTYEGPGQGSVIRDDGLPFTHEWEKPNAAVLDTFLATHEKPGKIVLIGMSFGGYLAPRAAAFDPRIDGVVSYDVWFDTASLQTSNSPLQAWMSRAGLGGLLNAWVAFQQAHSAEARFAMEHGMWTFGVKSPAELAAQGAKYTLVPVAERIRGDVLILAGGEDAFIPVEQVDRYRRALTRARSVHSVVFDRQSGGADHCQVGGIKRWQAALFDWLETTYGSRSAEPTTSTTEAVDA